MVPTTRWTLDDGVWTRLLRLHPQDASRVLSMHAQDSLLIVYQASERLSVSVSYTHLTLPTIYSV